MQAPSLLHVRPRFILKGPHGSLFFTKGRSRLPLSSSKKGTSELTAVMSLHKIEPWIRGGRREHKKQTESRGEATFARRDPRGVRLQGSQAFTLGATCL